MEFKKDDILIRTIRRSKDSVCWVSERLLFELCDISLDYAYKVRTRYKSSVQPCHRHHSILPDTGKSWRWAQINGSFYYDLKRLPNRKPTYFRDQFGDANKLVENYNNWLRNGQEKVLESELSLYIEQNYKEWYCEYVEGCSQQQQIALSKAATVVAFAAEKMQEGQYKGAVLYKKLVGLVEKMDLQYLPKNYRRFQDKVEAVLSGNLIVEVVKLPRAGMANALKYQDEQVLAWVVQLRSMGQNFSNEHIIRKVKEMCIIANKPIPSRRWFGSEILEQHHIKFITATGRFGRSGRRAHIYQGYIPMEGALFAGDCWQMDATRINIIAHKADDGKKKFLYIIAVRDVHSGDILGYSFDYSENRYTYRNALKMAVHNAGYLPYELVIDRFPGHNTEEWKDTKYRMESLGVKVTTTHLATGKSHIERSFGTIQSVIMMGSKYFYGEGIKSTRESAHRSAEYIKQITKSSVSNSVSWGLTEAYEEGVLIVETYRSTPLSHYSRKHRNVQKSPKQLHDESNKPHIAKYVSDVEAHMLFGMHKKVKIKHNGMIRTEIHNQEFVYHVDDYEVFSQIEEVVMAYDLEDLRQIYLYKKNDKMLVYLCEASMFNKPQIYGPDAEWNKVAKAKKRLKEIEERKQSDLEEITAPAGDETALMLGAHTDKSSAEEAETAMLLEDLKMKMAAGSSYESHSPLRVEHDDEDEIDINDFINNQL